MPLIQGGPPEWIWERTSDPLKCEVVSSQAPEGHTVYEFRVKCGLEIMRLQFFTEEEVRALQMQLDEGMAPRANGEPAKGGQQQGFRREPVQPDLEPGMYPQREGTVSNPDFKTAR